MKERRQFNRLRVLVCVTALLCFVSQLSVFPLQSAHAASSALELEALKQPPVINPTPQQLSVKGDGFLIGSEVGLISGPHTDPEALRRIKALLTAIGVTQIIEAADTDSPPAAPVNIWLGGPDENQGAEAALQSIGSSWPQSITSGEGYIVAANADVSGQKNIVIAGKSTHGTYYAERTFEQLLVQTGQGYGISSVEVIDWPVFEYRGAVEGFYGKPWTHEDRLSQIAFYGEQKLNTYIYAPKDDKYHRDKWREPYPPEDLARLKELVDAAKANHVDLVFAISPGGDMIFSSDAEFELLVQKAQAAWDLGVRSFAVYMDDIDPNLRHQEDRARFGADSNPSAAAQTYVLNRFNQQFLTPKKSEGAKRLITVPTDYFGLHTTPYIDRFADLLDEDVLVHWTGASVFDDHITTEKADAARAFYKHDILFWDNFPVNDTSRDKLYMAPLQGRDAKLYEHGIIGMVSNPMNEAEASKLALYNYGDYLWNPEQYDYERSWLQALDYLGGDIAEQLKTFAENNYSTPVSPNRESLTIAPIVTEFWTQYVQEQIDIQPIADQLMTELVKLQQAVSTIRQQLPNRQMVSEIEPHLTKMDWLTQAGIEALRMLLAQRNGYSQPVIMEHRIGLVMQMDKIKMMPEVRNNTVIWSFITRALEENSKMWGKEEVVERVPFSSLVTHEDYAIERMVDNDPNSFYWAHGSVYAMDKGEFFGIDLKEARTLKGIKVVMDEGDYLDKADIELSMDGVKWIKVASSSGQPTIETALPNYSARYIRLVAAARNSKWIKVKDFNVELARSDVKVSTTLSYTGYIPENMIDNNPNTYFWSGSTPKAGDEIRLDFPEPKVMNKVSLFMDYNYNVKKGVVEYLSEDGSWTKLCDLQGDSFKSVSFPEKLIKSLRLRITESQQTWLQVFEFMAERSDASDKQFPEVSLDRMAYQLLKDGQHQTRVIALDAEGNSADVTAKAHFVSTNPRSAVVDASGLVTAVANGKAEIIASYEGQYRLVNVTVTPDAVEVPELSSIELGTGEYRLEIGQTHQSVVYGLYDHGDKQIITEAVEFASAHPEIASVDSTGKVTALKEGETVITAKFQGFEATAAVTVSPNAVENPKLSSIELGTGEYRLEIGQTHQSVIYGLYDNGDKQIIKETVEFASAHPEIASVDSTGKVTALKEGETVITAKFQGFETTAKVTVQRDNPGDGGSGWIPPVTLPSMKGIQFDAAPSRIKLGDARKLTVRALYENGKSDPLTAKAVFTSSHLDIVSVDAEGNITGRSVGSAAITAKYDSFTATVAVQVVDGSKLQQQSERFEANQAGELKLGSQLIVRIPEGASAKPVAITATIIDNPGGIAASGMVLASPVFEIVKEPADDFAKPVTVELMIDPDKQEYEGAAVYFFDKSKQEWVKLEGQTAGRMITVQATRGGVFAIFAAEPAKAAQTEFKDTVNHWARNAIAEAAARGIVKGIGEETFRPNGLVTRAEFAAMLGRALQWEAEDAEAVFTDPIPAWAAGYVAAGAKLGIITGYADQTFGAEQQISRAEMTAMIVRALKLPLDASTKPAFKDANQIAKWAKPSVAAAAEANLIRGKGGQLFAPQDKTTRAEAVTVVMNMLNMLDN
ncbi:beta-N-acetylglucosaminidase domain-containing protein [Paenibacillus sp. GCM10027626]|uniref:beta-N-acetylglucosaminidase domain-containing protein n=1 Tax=Paenibacillus sp. GCM10027626 TaxID=3273411 RepID=UPI00363EEADC